MNEDRFVDPQKTARLSDFWCLLCGSPLVAWPCLWCRGNAARAGLDAARLGTRFRYIPAAARVDRRQDNYASFEVLIELHRRCPAPPRSLRDWVRREVDAYAIDAPETMPAGSCVRVEVPEAAEPDDPEPFYVAQRTSSREGVSPSDTAALDNPRSVE